MGHPSRRVKLYQLNLEGNWDDKGTGYITCEISDNDNGNNTVLVVRSEQSDGDILLEHTVDANIVYERQGQTILTWCEPNTEIDLALSFQEPQGCSEIIECIEGWQSQADFFETDAMDSLISAPWPELSNLEDICSIVKGANAYQRDSLATQIIDGGYIGRLFELFDMLEEHAPADKTLLFSMFGIFQGMFLLNNKQLLSVLLTDDNVLRTVAALEYDPELPSIHVPNYHQHREFLELTQFKEVIPLKEDSIILRIHQNYRITFIKDAILLRSLDDATASSLNNIIFYNNVYILTKICEDDDLFKILFKQLLPDSLSLTTLMNAGNSSSVLLSRLKASINEGEKDDTSAEQMLEGVWETKKDAFLFLQHLCTLANTIDAQHRLSLYQRFFEYKLLQVVELAMTTSSPSRSLWLWRILSDLLTCMLLNEPRTTREMILSEMEMVHEEISTNKTLLGCIISIVVSASAEVDVGLMQQLSELLKVLLDMDNIASTMADGTIESVPISFEVKEIYISSFLGRYLSLLLDSITRESVISSPAISQADQAAKFHSIELLTYIVGEHSSLLKPYLASHLLISSVMKPLLKSPAKYIILSAIRFLRTCVGLAAEKLPDELSSSLDDRVLSRSEEEENGRYSDVAHFASCISESRALEHVLEVFFKNGSRYNMLNSVIIELVEFIRIKNIKVLVTQLVTKYQKQFQEIDYVNTFSMLIIRHQRNIEEKQSPSLPTTDWPVDYDHNWRDTDDDESILSIPRREGLSPGLPTSDPDFGNFFSVNSPPSSPPRIHNTRASISPPPCSPPPITDGGLNEHPSSAPPAVAPIDDSQFIQRRQSSSDEEDDYDLLNIIRRKATSKTTSSSSSSSVGNKKSFTFSRSLPLSSSSQHPPVSTGESRPLRGLAALYQAASSSDTVMNTALDDEESVQQQQKRAKFNTGNGPVL